MCDQTYFCQIYKYMWLWLLYNLLYSNALKRIKNFEKKNDERNMFNIPLEICS